MKKRNLRQLPRVSYSELEEPSLDEYVFCDECTDFVFEYCSLHGPLLVVPDDKVPPVSPFPPCVPRAALTIPHEFLHLAPSIIPDAGLGVFTTLTLPRGVRFGPYCGTNSYKVASMYCWQIRDHNNKPSHVVDASDANASNWMRYVNCARRWHEQNLVAYQYRGQIYYRTIKIIPKFTELMVFYGSDFAEALDIDLRLYNSPPGYAQKYGVPVPARCKANQDSKLNQTKIQQSSPNEKQVVAKTTTVPQKVEIEIITPGNTEKVIDKDNIFANRDKHIEKEIQKKAFSDKSNLTTPIRTHTGDKPYRCSHCSKAFNQKHVLTTHIRIHTGDKPYRCIHCSKEFSQKHVLTTHTGDKPYRCSHCSKAFCRKGHLTTHIRIHTGDKPYRCSHCSKAFNQKGDLTKHIRIHTGDKPYRCSHCSKAFNQKGDLTKHIRIHTGDKPYRCSHCSKAFCRKGDLTTHIRIHTGDKPYRCSHCSKAFCHKGHLTTHIRIHTGDKPYRCSHCSKAFCRKGDLTTHIRIHTGDKPYRCSHCSKAFCHKGHLTTHIRIHTGDKPYRCSHCSKAFCRKGHLTTHIRIHTGDKPYRCSHCSKAFSQTSALKSHFNMCLTDHI